jgi:hypothetical protein
MLFLLRSGVVSFVAGVPAVSRVPPVAGVPAVGGNSVVADIPVVAVIPVVSGFPFIAGIPVVDGNPVIAKTISLLALLLSFFIVADVPAVAHPYYCWPPVVVPVPGISADAVTVPVFPSVAGIFICCWRPYNFSASLTIKTPKLNVIFTDV